MTDDGNRLAKASDLGQSIWLDQISREMIAGGELQRLMQAGVAGVTTNPSIFEKAIGEGSSYDAQIAALAAEGRDAAQILDRIIIDDVRAGCDVLRPLYDRSTGGDGFVSIEVAPEYAFDTAVTISEARRLWEAVDRPNVMIKIPGTREGIPAIRASLADGININITLMFSMAHYEAVVEAFFAGLEDRLAAGRGLRGIASVSSFFVSRVDNAVDALVDGRLGSATAADRDRLAGLKGVMAVANCKLVYQRFQELFAGPRWSHLSDNGAALQRVLWASTSTKNPAYPDLLYVDTLIGPRTVNTLPAATLAAFRDHGAVVETVTEGVDEAQAAFDTAAAMGIDMVAITEKLQVDGVAAFAKAFNGLLDHVAGKCRQLSETSAS